MSDFIGIDITGLPELEAKLAKLPDAAADDGVEAANTYIVNVMREYQPYRSITRKSVYGSSFKTDKQRRWFFAALRSGEIHVPYNRTQELRGSWKTAGDGRQQFVYSEDMPKAQYVMQDGHQNQLLKKMGWKTVETRMKERMSEIVRRFDAGVNKAIKRLGL